jgi:hypothetical protein
MLTRGQIMTARGQNIHTIANIILFKRLNYNHLINYLQIGSMDSSRPTAKNITK